MFGFHVRCGHYLAVLPPVWRSHALHSTRRDFVLKHIVHRRHDAIHILYPNPHISAQWGPLVFLCPAHGIVVSHSCLSSTCTTHGPRFVGTCVTIDETYPAHIFPTGVQAHPSQGPPGVVCARFVGLLCSLYFCAAHVDCGTQQKLWPGLGCTHTRKIGHVRMGRAGRAAALF